MTTQVARSISREQETCLFEVAAFANFEEFTDGVTR